jgi:hypothetical protein
LLPIRLRPADLLLEDLSAAGAFNSATCAVSDCPSVDTLA